MKSPSLLNRLASLLRMRGGAPERVLVHPMREWVTCLTIALTIGISLFVFASFDFYTQMTVVGDVTESDISVPRYRADEAASIIRYYEGKGAQFETIREAGVPIAAPITVEAGAVNNLEAAAVPVSTEVAGKTESQ